MDLWHTIVLGLAQGLLEFLPVSSSAHLILIPRFLGWPDQGLAFDVAVHVGTLAAVILYFREDLAVMSRDWMVSIRGGPLTPGGRLAWGVLAGTVPAGVAGLLINAEVEGRLRSPDIIAFATLGFGLLLWWADRRGRRLRDEHTLTWKDVLAIGAAQALSLVPGTSRSGITMTAGLAMGLDRRGAARFSFLLSVPIILFAGAFKTTELLWGAETVDGITLLIGAFTSGTSAYLTINYFLKLVDRMGLAPFAIYRIGLGLLLLVVF
jgi:undecaprenyl-diphosphatase